MLLKCAWHPLEEGGKKGGEVSQVYPAQGERSVKAHTPNPDPADLATSAQERTTHVSGPAGWCLQNNGKRVVCAQEA